MKNKFFEYYQFSDSLKREIWDKGKIILDTNAILNLYRFKIDTRKDFLKILERNKYRLWIPYQVGLEFHENRLNIISSLQKSYKDLETQIKAWQTDFTKHPYTNTKGTNSKILKCIDVLIKEMESHGQNEITILSDDPILNKISSLYNNRIGDDFSEDTLCKVYKEGESRYSQKIPPGFCDLKEKSKSSKRQLYGDLIIWKQIIKEAKDTKSNIIFVTNDAKEDWWFVKDGKTIGPRRELIREFYNESGQYIMIYSVDRFLEYAKENLNIAVKDNTIQEVNNIQESDKRRDDSIKWWEELAPLSGALSPSLVEKYADATSKLNTISAVLQPSTLGTLKDGSISSLLASSQPSALGALTGDSLSTLLAASQPSTLGALTGDSLSSLLAASQPSTLGTLKDGSISSLIATSQPSTLGILAGDSLSTLNGTVQTSISNASQLGPQTSPIIGTAPKDVNKKEDSNNKK